MNEHHVLCHHLVRIRFKVIVIMCIYSPLIHTDTATPSTQAAHVQSLGALLLQQVAAAAAMQGHQHQQQQHQQQSLNAPMIDEQSLDIDGDDYIPVLPEDDEPEDEDDDEEDEEDEDDEYVEVADDVADLDEQELDNDEHPYAQHLQQLLAQAVGDDEPDGTPHVHYINISRISQLTFLKICLDIPFDNEAAMMELAIALSLQENVLLIIRLGKYISCVAMRSDFRVDKQLMVLHINNTADYSRHCQ